jgi:FkbM family methyltransferase
MRRAASDAGSQGLSIHYYTQILRRRAFVQEPLLTIFRGAKWLLYHRLLSREALVRIPVGDTSFSLALPPLQRHHGSAGIFVERHYYEPLLECADALARPGDVVFDCGANQGIYSCAFAALVGPSGRVEAFEPQRYAARCAERNISLNGFRNARVNRAAVSSREGQVFLDTSRGPVAASIVRTFGSVSGEIVPTISLDGFTEANSIRRVDLIKMDIEGAEFDALVGARKLIASSLPILILEANEVDVAWLKSWEFLEQLGYLIYDLSPQKRLVQLEHLSGAHSCVVLAVEERVRELSRNRVQQ